MTPLLTSSVFMIIACFAIVKITGNIGDQLSKLATKWGVSPAVRGVLFDSPVSSMPELFTGIVTALLTLGFFTSKPDPTAFSDVGIGAIGGSAIFNILIIPFFSLLFIKEEKLKEIVINKKYMIIDMCVYLIAVGILYISARIGIMNRIVGGIMTFTYIFYAIYLIKRDKKLEIESANEKIKEKTIIILLKIVLGLIPLAIVVQLCVKYAEIIGTELHISRLVMSLIVLAATTSIPDTVLSIKSARNGELDASIANAVGSNSFDILICLGFVLFISGINVKINFDEISFIFKFLLLSSFLYTIAFLVNAGKIIKLSLLCLPYFGFIYYVSRII